MCPLVLNIFVIIVHLKGKNLYQVFILFICYVKFQELLKLVKPTTKEVGNQFKRQCGCHIDDKPC